VDVGHQDRQQHHHAANGTGDAPSFNHSGRYQAVGQSDGCPASGWPGRTSPAS
jgi:hypothetical protein